ADGPSLQHSAARPRRRRQPALELALGRTGHRGRVLGPGREPTGHEACRGGMKRDRSLTTALAVVLVAAACSGRPAGSASAERPTPTASISEATQPISRGAPTSRSGLTGRIAFDNHDDVWTINADGTDLT